MWGPIRAHDRLLVLSPPRPAHRRRLPHRQQGQRLDPLVAIQEHVEPRPPGDSTMITALQEG